MPGGQAGGRVTQSAKRTGNREAEWRQAFAARPGMW
jgi:hypothetical protein